jgi:hypothetical protein
VSERVSDGTRTPDNQSHNLSNAFRNLLSDHHLRQNDPGIRSTSVAADPIVAALTVLASLTPDQRAALAVLLNTTAPTPPAPQPAPATPQIPDDTLPWERRGG